MCPPFPSSAISSHTSPTSSSSDIANSPWNLGILQTSRRYMCILASCMAVLLGFILIATYLLLLLFIPRKTRLLPLQPALCKTNHYKIKCSS